MEFIEEDAHPVYELLDFGPDTASNSGAYNGNYVYSSNYTGKYQDFKKPGQPGTTQVMPGVANVPLAMRAKALETNVNPGDANKAANMPMRHEKDAASVEYIDKKDVRKRREAYEVSIGPTMKRGGKGQAPMPFDTKEIKAAYLDRSDIGCARLGANDLQDNKFLKLRDEWVVNSLIWVCTPEPGRLGAVFYSNVCRIGQFHHSSFTSGSNLIGAGEWIVEQGHLKRISANSGHYTPTIHEFHRAVMFMKDAWHQDTEVMLFNVKADNWEYVPVSYFKVDATGGGKYVAHPASIGAA